MSEEEKKAIKDCDIIFINLEDMLSEESANDYRNSYKILKNLIDKQQKEIEEYKEHYENMKWYYDNQKDNLIHKDKIREKIKKCKENEKDFAFIDNKSYARDFNRDLIKAYEELLEGN